MLASKGWRVLILGTVLTVLCASVDAQQKVYKWVDEDGVVHFSEEAPAVPPGVKVEVVTTDPAPPPTPRAQTEVKSPPPTAAREPVAELRMPPDTVARVPDASLSSPPLIVA